MESEGSANTSREVLNDETKTEIVSEKANNDFKRDMFRYKDEVRELKEKLKTIELSDEEKKGNYEKVIQTLKDEIKEQKAFVAKTTFNNAKNSVESSIKGELLRQGCKFPSEFMRLLGSEYMEAVSVDPDNFKPDQDDVKRFVDNGIKKYGEIEGFFKKDKPNFVDGTPSKQEKVKVKIKTPRDMTQSEIIAKLKELDNNKNK